MSDVTEVSNAKLVYFNRQETEVACDKHDDNELFTLRNKFECQPDKCLYLVKYYCPTGDAHGQIGTYEHGFRATDEADVKAQFNKWRDELGADMRMNIKSITLMERAKFKL